MVFFPSFCAVSLLYTSDDVIRLKLTYFSDFNLNGCFILQYVANLSYWEYLKVGIVYFNDAVIYIRRKTILLQIEFYWVLLHNKNFQLKSRFFSFISCLHLHSYFLCTFFVRSYYTKYFYTFVITMSIMTFSHSKWNFYEL